jgi:hypothetical protein
VGQGLREPSQNDIALALVGEGVELLDDLVGGDVALQTLVAELEKDIELLFLEFLDFLVQDSSLELLLVHDPLLEVVEFADKLDDVAVALQKDLSGSPLARLDHLWADSKGLSCLAWHILLGLALTRVDLLGYCGLPWGLRASRSERLEVELQKALADLARRVAFRIHRLEDLCEENVLHVLFELFLHHGTKGATQLLAV